MADTLATPDVLVRADAETGEGPVIDARSGLLAWVDIPRGTLYQTDRSTGETTVRRYPTMLGAVAPRMRNGSRSAGSATMNVRPISRNGARAGLCSSRRWRSAMCDRRL